MAEIRLKKRYKYAGDIMPKLLDIGFDIETANGFLNSIKDADVAPRAEVAREIFEEIERIFDQHTEGGYYLNGVWFHKRLDLDTREAIAELKKKYTEGEK